jgi:predicted secreted protein
MEMNQTRRIVLRGAGSIGALSALIMAGVLKPTAAYAADWNKAAFEAKDTPAALKGLGAGSTAESKDLVLKVPDIAENGAVVPVDVTSNIPNTISLAVLVDKNPTRSPAPSISPTAPARGGRCASRWARPRWSRPWPRRGRQVLHRQEGSEGHRRRLRRLIEPRNERKNTWQIQ